MKILPTVYIYLIIFSYLLNQYQDLNNSIILTVVEKIQEIKGAFNCICLIEDFGLICFKDKYNIRPLVLGKKKRKLYYFIGICFYYQYKLHPVGRYSRK